MPRYRFNWSNLPAPLLRNLASDLRLEGDPADGLRAAYGVRPRADFVRDTWPTLLASWLSRDRSRARGVARRLRELNLGDTSERDDGTYLAGLRNTANLRQVVLDSFIEFGEQTAEARSTTVAVSSPAPAPPRRFDAPRPDDRRVEAPAPEAAEGVVPLGDGHGPSPDGGAAEPSSDVVGGSLGSDEDDVPSLFKFVAGVMVGLLGENVHLDDDGDFVVQMGSSVTYVQVTTEPEAVKLFSVLVVDVPQSPRVFELCNSINSTLMIGRLVFSNGALLLEHVLLPMGLHAEEIGVALRMVATAADYFDHRLQSELGGRIALAERADDEIDV